MKKLIYILFILSISATSCKKDDDPAVPCNCQSSQIAIELQNAVAGKIINSVLIKTDASGMFFEDNPVIEFTQSSFVINHQYHQFHFNLSDIIWFDLSQDYADRFHLSVLLHN